MMLLDFPEIGLSQIYIFLNLWERVFWSDFNNLFFFHKHKNASVNVRLEAFVDNFAIWEFKTCPDFWHIWFLFSHKLEMQKTK